MRDAVNRTTMEGHAVPSSPHAGWSGWITAVVCVLVLTGCGWDPAKPFDRNAPEVEQAIAALDAGKPDGAAELLTRYLNTGKCSKGKIGVPETVRKRPDGTFDLGLALFALAEKYGQRFGDEEVGRGGDAGPSPEQQALDQLRSENVDCALSLLDAIAVTTSVPLELRARARYLEGNLQFLRRHYRDAVSAYDEALAMIPGLKLDAGDQTGSDAAWNRAIALKRIEDQKDAGNDGGKDASPDGPPDAGKDAPKDSNDENDSGKDASPDSGNDGGKDGGGDSGRDSGSDGGGRDAGKDGGKDGGARNQPPDAGSHDASTPPPSRAQDEKILDMLESAPTIQVHKAKVNAGRRRIRGMEDK